MDIEQVREYCLSLPSATEDFPFDEVTLAFRVEGRIFAMIDPEWPDWFVLKCEPGYALELREMHAEITGAWHMNKKHWNQVSLFGSLSDDLVRSLIRHSYAQVVRKLPLRVRAANPAILAVKE